MVVVGILQTDEAVGGVLQVVVHPSQVALLWLERLIQNTFGIPRVSELMSRQNMDDILLAEAMRRSMSMDQQVSREEEVGKGSTTESNENKSLLELARGNNEDDLLAEAIALSLQEQKNKEGDSSTNQDNDDKDRAALDSQSLKGNLKKQSSPAGSASLDPVSNNKQVRQTPKLVQLLRRRSGLTQSKKPFIAPLNNRNCHKAPALIASR